MKRIICMILCLILALSILSACGSTADTDKSAASTVSAATNAAAEEELPETFLTPAKEPVEFRYMVRENYLSSKPFSSQLPVWQEIEKLTNIKIKWEAYPTEGFEDVITTTMAAGADLPDIISNWGFDSKYAQGGLILELNSLIEKNAPNITKLMQEMPIYKAEMSDPEGKIWKVNGIIPSMDYKHGYIINKTWLDKLSLNVPTTMDEMNTVLRAFRDNDPNANKKKDEVPFALRGWFQSWYMALSYNSFPMKAFAPDANGKMQYECTTDSFKSWLENVNIWYTEKLMDQNFATTNYDNYIAMITNDLVGLTLDEISETDKLNKANPKAHWIPIQYPVGPSGQPVKILNLSPVSGQCAVITNSCTDPDTAMKFIDFVLASEKGKLLMNYGLEGQSYNMVDGKPVYTELVTKNPDGMSALDTLNSLGAYVQWSVPMMSSADMTAATTSEEVRKFNDEVRRNTPYVDLYNAYGGPMTPAESDAFWKAFEPVYTYKDEMVMKFIMGKEPFSKWQEYKIKHEEVGVQKCIDMEQAAYDKFLSLMK